MSPRIDMVGKRFDRLTVESRAENDKWKRAQWLCKCDCGGRAIVPGFQLRVRSSRGQSCGCRQFAGGGRKPTHGLSLGREYNTWASMIQRCTNPNAPDYKWYGAIGVSVCYRWLNSFENFFADMGERPHDKTLDRYPNPYGNYEPSNCRWASQLLPAVLRHAK